MKIRTGFVSNSSSSSFICVVCGSTESGMDLGLEDFYMMECENGHLMCEDHVDNDQEVIDNNKEGRYGFPSKNCPVCNFDKLTDKDIIGYSIKTEKISEEGLKSELKEAFKSYKEFREFMKK